MATHAYPYLHIIFTAVLNARSIKSPWRNRLARLTVNQKVGGSSPPGDVKLFFTLQLLCASKAISLKFLRDLKKHTRGEATMFFPNLAIDWDWFASSEIGTGLQLQWIVLIKQKSRLYVCDWDVFVFIGRGSIFGETAASCVQANVLSSVFRTDCENWH